MNQEFNTIELARLYDEQGHARDALTIYKELAKKITPETDPEIISELNMAVERLEKTVSSSGAGGGEDGTAGRLSRLLEEWLMLMVLEKRLSSLKQVKIRI